MATKDLIRYLREQYLPWCPKGQFQGVLSTILHLEAVQESLNSHAKDSRSK